MNQDSMKKYIAECIGTMCLVLFGCGTAMVLGPGTSAGAYMATALAFGLAIVAMAYSIGNISGCHVNPAVSLGVYLNGGMTLRDFIGYIIAQFAGALVGTGVLAFIFGLGNVADRTGAEEIEGLFELNGFGANTMAGVGNNHFVGFIVEIILTFVFVFVILSVTAKKKKGSALNGLVIGLTLTLIHLLGIGLTGTSVNPARSFGPAIGAAFGGNLVPIVCLWAFILGPAIGAVLAAVVYRYFEGGKTAKASAPAHSEKKPKHKEAPAE